MTERCNPPACLRVIGHAGRCTVRCGAWMPVAETRCARRVGHGNGHRSAWDLEYARETERRDRSVTVNARSMYNGGTGTSGTSATIRDCRRGVLLVPEAAATLRSSGTRR